MDPVLVQHDYAPGEILALVKTQIAMADERITKMLAVQPKTFANTVEAFETILADLIERTKPARFLRFVHTQKAVRDESKEAETQLSAHIIKTTSRQDIYDALSAQSTSQELTEAQRRLHEKTLREFRKRGLGAPPAVREQITAWQQELAQLQTQFEANIAESNARVIATEDELEGVPPTAVARFERTDDGRYSISTNGTDFVPIMQYAKDPGLRKRMLIAYENRAAQQNTKLLERALQLRRDLAASLGYSTWADFRIEDKMAKTATAVAMFLGDLRGKLAARNAADLNRLLLRKRRENPDAQLYPWDLAYYETLIRREELSVDDEEIRKYFPAEQTIARMFEIYSTLFGITITQVPSQLAGAWADRVQLYAVRDADGAMLSHFYTDFYPREGKYEHAAAFTLRSGRMLNGTGGSPGSYVTPISAIVSNFTPAAGDVPSLLSHDEVETLFHEFGHIMHQDLTRAPYAFISGTDVPMDFVEMPSQIMENWAWDEVMLARISSHYQTGQPLPAATIARMIDARHFNEARHYTRQLANSIYDLQIHMSAEQVEPIAAWRAVYQDVTTLAPLPETHYPAGFGHLMGGYDAGYYSYLWSKVYAEDLFTRFKKEGLLNPKTGKEYRRLILEPGDSRDPMQLMREFLGREPSSDAFMESIGVQ